MAFAEQMQEGEEVCVIGFDDDIVFIHEFSGNKETVKGYATHEKTVFTNIADARSKLSGAMNKNDVKAIQNSKKAK